MTFCEPYTFWILLQEIFCPLENGPVLLEGCLRRFSLKSSSNIFSSHLGVIISLTLSISLTVILFTVTLFVNGSEVKCSGPLTVQPCFSCNAKGPSPSFGTTLSGIRAFGQLLPIKSPISISGS